MKDSGTAILHAAAQQARGILIAEAVAPPRRGIGVRLKCATGRWIAKDGRRVGYGDLVAGQALHVAEGQSPHEGCARGPVMGKAVHRVDIPAKVTGGAAYVHDLRLPGMVHARIVRPPQPGARLKSLDVAVAERMPGVLKVVRDGSFVAVVRLGRIPGDPRDARAPIARRSRWRRCLGRRPCAPSAAAFREQRHPRSQRRRSLGAMTHEATFRRAYQLHGAIGPSCAVARFDEGKLEVWTHSQGVYPLREALAELGETAFRSRPLHPHGRLRVLRPQRRRRRGRRRGAHRARHAGKTGARAMDARRGSTRGEPFGSAMVTKARAALDASGRITACGIRRLEHAPFDAARQGRKSGRGHVGRRPVHAAAAVIRFRSRKAAATATRSRSTRSPAEGHQSLHRRDAAARVPRCAPSAPT